MSKTVQWKRGNANVSTAYIGAQGEITVDTSEWALRLHDGLTPGGFKISNDTDSNVDIGNLQITNQTIQGKNSNQDVNINASGNANVVLFGQSAVVSNDIYVQGNATVDGIIIQSNTISTVNSAGNLILSSSLGNVITPARFFANSIRLTNENFYIEQVFNNFLNRNVVSLYSAINNAQDITIRANNTFVGYHASPFGTLGIRTFASNTVPVTILGNTSIIGNLTSDSYRTSNEYSSYTFASNTGTISGLQHRLFSANVNVLALIHDNFEVARFLSNSLTQLTGNVIITGGAGVQNIADFPEGRLQIYSNVNTYSQIVHQNLSQGNTASSDYVATANNGDDTTFYVDLGIAGNLHTDPNFFGDTSTFNDAYLYVTGYNQAGPSTGNIGNLIIGSTNGIVKTFIGNTAEANVITVVDSTGLVPGANVVYSLGSATRQWKDLLVGNITLSGNLNAGLNATITGNLITGNTYVPSAANSAGTKGQITYDSNYVYICVATNTWKRANLSSW